ncbi:MAG: STAS domain-containing protein [bacterium]|nr:STAS domain-containing protein [bacterium]
MIRLTTEKKDGVIIIHMNGVCDIQTIKYVENTWNELAGKKPETIAIDCLELEYFDSTAIGALVRFLKITVEKQINLVLYDLQDPMAKLFSRARLNKFIKITTRKKFEKEYDKSGIISQEKDTRVFYPEF